MFSDNVLINKWEWLPDINVQQYNHEKGKLLDKDNKEVHFS